MFRKKCLFEKKVRLGFPVCPQSLIRQTQHLRGEKLCSPVCRGLASCPVVEDGLEVTWQRLHDGVHVLLQLLAHHVRQRQTLVRRLSQFVPNPKNLIGKRRKKVGHC